MARKRKTDRCRVIMNANQKGGVGKTTSTTEELVVVTLPNKEFNYKALAIDWDRQANATSLLGKTFNTNFPKSIYKCIEDNDLRSGIVELTDNLHMIAGGGDITDLGNFLELEYPYPTEISFSSKLASVLRNRYRITDEQAQNILDVLEPLESKYSNNFSLTENEQEGDLLATLLDKIQYLLTNTEILTLVEKDELGLALKEEFSFIMKDLQTPEFREVQKKRTFHFSKLLDTIKDDYDYIWIDVGPSTDIKVDNAMVCADYFIITQETKTYSFEGSVDIIQVYIQTLIDDFGEDFKGEVLGLLPFLLQPKRNLHESIIDQTKEIFGENFTFNAIITNQKRLEDYPEYGIEVRDYHDRRIFALFADVVKEMEERINFFETIGDIPDDYKYKPQYLNGNKLTAKSKALDLSQYESKKEV